MKRLQKMLSSCKALQFLVGKFCRYYLTTDYLESVQIEPLYSHNLITARKKTRKDAKSANCYMQWSVNFVQTTIVQLAVPKISEYSIENAYCAAPQDGVYIATPVFTEKVTIKIV